MTQHVDQPLLTEPDGAPSTPPKRRRAATAKASPARNGDSVEPAKPKARRAPKKAEVAATDDLPGLNGGQPAVESAPSPPPEPEPAQRAKPAPRRRRAEAAAVPPPLAPGPAHAVEEWSPARASAAKEAPVAESKPEPKAEAPRVAEVAFEAPAPSSSAAPVDAPAASNEPPAAFAAARKYPVYIPRHVARQMEEQGQTAPLAVPADAIPEAARAAVEAAQAAQAASHAAPARPEQHGHQPSHREHGRPEHRDRGDRGGRDRGGRDRDRHREGGQRDHQREGNRERERDQDPERDYVPSDAPLEEDLGIGEGIVEISGKGFGFIRDAKRNFAQHPQDIFVTPELVRKYNLRDGQWIKGEMRRGGRGAQLCKLLEVNGGEAELSRILPAFDELTVVSPMERITLEINPDRYTTRIIDLFAPIGKGQRGIIVAPPRTGKTTLLQHIADAVLKKHPEIVLIILLVDERPEEVTDIKRSLPGAEVWASSNDMDVKSHTRIAQLAIERAKRLVESGKDVFVLLDSITRVGRAFNNAMANGGRTMSGGVDARALETPRRIFAAARNTEEAGSLTIVATALIDTGSKADELIFQEFKGTGNMELVLDRKISDQRIYPAIDIFQSGTRREELLIPADDLHKIAIIRRGLSGHKPLEAIERLLYFLRKFPTNSQMLREIPG